MDGMASFSPTANITFSNNIRLTPEELARLDTSVTNFLNNYTVPSIHFDTKRPEVNGSELDEIGGGLSAGRLMGSGKQKPVAPLTPPITSPIADPVKPANAFLAPSTRSTNQVKPDTSDIKRLYEERLAMMQRNEQERVRMIEEEHRRQVCKLQSEYSDLQQKYESVNRRKDELINQVDRMSHDLSKLATINQQSNNTFGSIFDVNINSTIEQIKNEYEKKISDLIEQFNREKQAANRILSTKLRSHLSLLLPKLRQQARSEVQVTLAREKEEEVNRCRQECQQAIERLKNEHLMERRVAVKVAKEEAEAAAREWQFKIREKMRLKLAQVRNESERNVLKRLSMKY